MVSSYPHIQSAAERMFDTLRERHLRIAAELGDGETLPNWFLHLPSGAVVPIRQIGHDGPFLRVVGYGASETNIDFTLVAPESVVITVQTPEPDEPRRPIGFTA